MAETRIEQLREIVAKAAARDEELQRALETFAADLLKELGADDKPPVWTEIKAAKAERQVTARFVMAAVWLLGDLVIEVAPDVKLGLSLRMRTTKDKTHEASLAMEPSQGVVIDLPDEKSRASNRKKFFEHIFAHLEGQLRRSVELPAE